MLYQYFSKIKSLILITLVFTVTIFTYNSQRVYALDGRTYVTIAEAAAITATTAAETGATVALAPIVVTSLIVGALAYGGYTLVKTYGKSFSDYLSKTSSNLSHEELNDYVYNYTKDGQTYIGLTKDGYDWSISKAQNYTSNDTIDYEYTPSSNKITSDLNYTWIIDNTTVEKRYSTPSITVDAGDTITWFLKTFDSPVIKQYKTTKKTTFRIYSSYESNYNWNNYYISSDDSTLCPSQYIGYCGLGTKLNIGYKTDSGHVAVSKKDVIEYVTPSTLLDADQTVAIPVSTTEIEGMTSCTTSVVPDTVTKNDTVVVSLSDTKPNVDSSTDTPGISSSIISEGIKDTLKVPSNDIPKLDFSPLMVATQKFPFSIPWDLWNSVKLFSGSATTFSYEFTEVKAFNIITVLPNFKVDFADYPEVDVCVKVLRLLELLFFIVFLIVKTRGLIRG